MEETRKEKSIRLLLIGFFVVVTIVALQYRQGKLSSHEQMQPTTALVLQQSEQRGERPLVALYEYKQKQHYLNLYEIDQERQYKFNVIASVVLREKPTELKLDKLELGLWALLGNQWHYYNGRLEETGRESRMRESTMDPSQLEYSYEQEDGGVFIEGRRLFTLPQGEIPREIHLLSKMPPVYLIITNKNVKISTIATE